VQEGDVFEFPVISQLDRIGAIALIDEPACGELEITIHGRVGIIDAVVVHQHGEPVAAPLVDRLDGGMDHIPDPVVLAARGGDDKPLRRHQIAERRIDLREVLGAVTLGIDPDAPGEAGGIEGRG
jgi:hypothetical protein